MHLAIFILICCIWGTSFILMKWSLQSFGPVGVGAVRVILGAVALGLVWQLGQRRWPLRRADLVALTALALIAYCDHHELLALVHVRHGRASRICAQIVFPNQCPGSLVKRADIRVAFGLVKQESLRQY